MSNFRTLRSHTFFHPLLSHDSIVFDVGSNRGEFSSRLAQDFQCRYFLFEPNPHLSPSIDLESIQCEAKFFSCALGGSTRTATFNLAENDEASSLLDLPDESKIGAVTKGKEEVKVIDLCTAMSMANVNNIDLLKLDIEGTEVEVLNSITQETADRISQISVEFHSAPEFDLSIDHDVPKTIEYLKDIGYIFLDFSRKSRRNCLFLNRNHVDIGWLKEIYYSVRHNHLPFVKSKVTNFCK